MEKAGKLLIIFLCVLSIGCIEKPDFDNIELENMSQLSVPEGFDFRSEEHFNVKIELSLPDENDYAQLNIYSDEDLTRQVILENGLNQFDFDLGFHKKKIKLSSFWNGKEFHREFEKHDLLNINLNQESFSYYDGTGSANNNGNGNGNGNINGNGNGTDTDGDGVKDDLDLEPNNPSVSQAIYIPALETYNTIGFEDSWPAEGDYDYNDLVVSFNLNKYLSKTNKLSRVETHFKLLAIGAGYDNDFCYMLDIPYEHAQIEISDPNINYTVHNIDGKTEVRFESIKSIFETTGFVNTVQNEAYYEPINFSLMTTVLNDENINGNSLAYDFFIRINGEEGREVHMAGQHPTGKINRTYFGDNPNGNSHLYLNDRNLPWVVMIPEIWEYPAEKIEILAAYPDFADFAQNNTNFPWYSDFHGGRVVRTKLFKKRD